MAAISIQRVDIYVLRYVIDQCAALRRRALVCQALHAAVPLIKRVSSLRRKRSCRAWRPPGPRSLCEYQSSPLSANSLLQGVSCAAALTFELIITSWVKLVVLYTGSAGLLLYTTMHYTSDMQVQLMHLVVTHR